MQKSLFAAANVYSIITPSFYAKFCFSGTITHLLILQIYRLKTYEAFQIQPSNFPTLNIHYVQ
ncbi:hypothetical protein S225a_09750 [Candidatus Brocadiaceae bacterium S225]|nr:hypothetical protein S225a_09750 [Candidatus Brocadiaceae bacterium S225]